MRKFAQIHLSVWNDDDFCDLSAMSQLLYFVLLSHPSMNRAGVGTWHPGRLAELNADWTREDVEQSGRELEQANFIVLDPDTDEFLVRSFLRHDGLLKQKNLATTMAREFAAVGSRHIRGVVVHELKRLNSEYPDWRGWESVEASRLLEKRGIDPSVDPPIDPYVDPKVHPSIDPSVKGEPKGSIGPSVDPSVDPSPTTATTTTTFSTNGKLEREGQAGVDGGLGEEGGTTTDQDTTAHTESAPLPQSLDELAARYAARTREPGVCPDHPNGDTGKECGGCAQARRERQHQTDTTRKERRAAIDNCEWCDTNGIYHHNGQATRCPHIDTPPQVEQPDDDQRPDVDQTFIDTLIARTHKPAWQPPTKNTA